MSTTELSIEKFKSRVRGTIALLVVAVIGISIWGIVSEYKTVITLAEQQAEGYVRALSEHSESAFAESDRVLRDVLHDLQKAGGIKGENHQQLFHELQRQVGNSPQIGSLFLVNKSGVMFLNSIEFPGKQISVADREYFRYYMATPGADLSISNPVMSRLVNRWRFNLMRPLNDPAKPFDGMLAVAFEVDYFKRFLRDGSLGPNGRIALVRTDGIPLAFEPFMAKIYETSLSNTILFREKLPHASSGTFHVGQNHNPVDSAPRIVSYQLLSRFPVVAVVSLDKHDVLKPWRDKALLQSGLTIGLCFSIILLVQLLMRYLDRLQSAQTALGTQQEQARIKAAQIDAAHDGILLLDMNGRLIQANNALCRLTGYSQEELTGKQLSELEPPEHAARITLNLSMLRERSEATFESSYLTRSGTIQPVEVSARIMESDGTSFVLSIVRDISERKRSERRESTKAGILEKLATDANLPELLTHIVQYVEQECENSICSVLLADEDCQHLYHGAAPSLPDNYNKAVNGLRIADGMGSCGTAAYLRQRVIVEDIETSPYWKGFAPAREAGLRSCWSEPVISATGELLGTFAVYHREPSLPEKSEIQLIESAAHLASIAIDRFRNDLQKKKLESQLYHVQRIEAVGQLAGGIAHDFNNLLTPVLVYAEMIQRKLPKDDPLADKAQGIINAACKARDLTQQLLCFGRKQLLTLQPLDLNEVIGSFHDILRRTIRENIAIYLQPAPGGVVVKADRGQIEQILLNLAVNAQHAISGNGTIVMETGHVMLDNEYARLHPGLHPGRYALLAFIDSGCGMDYETLSHIFEPFFTTKQVGQGTGLGLATVYGIVKQHEGYIAVSSRVGEGTVFSLYLPLCDEQLAEQPTPVVPVVLGSHPSGDSTVLVVEDNEMVRTMTVELLKSAGYRVLSAELPSLALELALETTVTVDLLVTDVMMPEMNGRELYEQLHDSLPDLRVLYISGYANEVFVHKGMLEESVNFLQKPFTAERFLERVRLNLGQKVESELTG
ncbi:MAG: histidine kinase [Geobacteraceae bacterium GWB2_52_12]|nr:MAG: histidine kinase [Geobacteraceae bacterium GWB2_52_12]